MTPTRRPNSGNSPLVAGLPLKQPQQERELHPFRPQARTTGLSIEPIGDELVIWDAVHNHYHTLNATSRDVWFHCNGEFPIEHFPALLGLPEEVVGLAIKQLHAAGLLTGVGPDLPQTASISTHLTRRQVVTRLAAAGIVGAVVLPTIGSITGVDSTAAISPGAQFQLCLTNQCAPGCPAVGTCFCAPGGCNSGFGCLGNICAVGCGAENTCVCNQAFCPNICDTAPCLPGCPAATTCQCDFNVCCQETPCRAGCPLEFTCDCDGQYCTS